MYQIKTQQFEGPLDLLLELIEKDDLDITKMSLAKVTDEYIAKLKDIENGITMAEMSEFLEVAARLILIKSKALIPSFALTEEESLSAEELELRLREYKRFKEAGEIFRRKFSKKLFSFDKLADFSEEIVFSPPPDIGANELKSVFEDIIGHISTEEILEEEVVIEKVSIEEKIDHILNNIEQRMTTCFKELHKNGSRVEVVVTFLALLELLKQKHIQASQDDIFGEIKIEKNNQTNSENNIQ